jgi:hypothetical protein
MRLPRRASFFAAVFVALPALAEKLPPAFRAEAYQYREPHRVSVEATVLATPVVVLDAPSDVVRGGDPPRVGIVRTLAEPYDSARARASSVSAPLMASFRSTGASRVRLHLTNVRLSGDLVVYGRDGLARAFGPELVSDDGDLWTPSVSGDTIVIAYASADRFTVSAVAHVFVAAPASTSCFTDVACSSFSDRDTLSRSIAAIEYVNGNGVFACTGGLINANVSDRLFLTANHCISNQAEATSLELTWDFRSSSCGSTTTLPTPKTNGGFLLVTSTTSDVTLLRLQSLPTNRYLMGWDTTRPASGTTLYRISHPLTASADATYQQLYSTTTLNETVGVCTGRTRPAYLYSVRSIGGTAGGSSGSPVIIQGGYIVGQLFGACGPDPTDSCASNTNAVDGWLGQSFTVLQPFLQQAMATCTPSSSNLCLLGNRFRVTLNVNDPRVSGAGSANATAQGDWGYFDVPAATGSTDKPVVFVKVIDGRPVNNRYWVFYGGLTDLQYSFTVTDVQTGASKTYTKASGTYDGAADTNAFPGN